MEHSPIPSLITGLIPGVNPIVLSGADALMSLIRSFCPGGANALMSLIRSFCPGGADALMSLIRSFCPGGADGLVSMTWGGLGNSDPRIYQSAS
ncbi:hypothetical protein [Leptothoe sp. PORK10 BA2]|uniref:hypothetical protein n=1 Tax=Leptothoe sp. PORK10 BA2 TaxID=3110254 RepID=UPI002B1F4944|nr:hypothetical protein [Leptothoe sp. PORK10 BA2]